MILSKKEVEKRKKILKKRIKLKSKYGYFSGKLNPGWIDDGREMQLENDFYFYEKTKKGYRQWKAENGSIVDGSSIPSAVWSLLGLSPFVGNHRRASVNHDVECKKKRRPYQEVHKMYHNGCLAGGTNRFMAGLLYFFVKNWGPRWQRKEY